MGVRARLGKGLEATLGKERTNSIRNAERRTRQWLADKLAPPPAHRARPPEPAAQAANVRKPDPGANVRRLGEPNDRQGGWIPSDRLRPYVEPRRPRRRPGHGAQRNCGFRRDQSGQRPKCWFVIAFTIHRAASACGVSPHKSINAAERRPLTEHWRPFAEKHHNDFMRSARGPTPSARDFRTRDRPGRSGTQQLGTFLRTTP